MQTTNLTTCNISVTQNAVSLMEWIEYRNSKGADYDFGLEELQFICNLGPVVLLDREVSVSKTSTEKCFMMFMDKSTDGSNCNSVIINEDHMFVDYVGVLDAFPELSGITALFPVLGKLLSPEYIRG